MRFIPESVCHKRWRSVGGRHCIFSLRGLFQKSKLSTRRDQIHDLWNQMKLTFVSYDEVSVTKARSLLYKGSLWFQLLFPHNSLSWLLWDRPWNHPSLCGCLESGARKQCALILVFDLFLGSAIFQPGWRVSVDDGPCTKQHGLSLPFQGLLLDDKVLAAAIWRHFFEYDCHDATKVETLVHYVRKQVTNCSGLNSISERELKPACSFCLGCLFLVFVQNSDNPDSEPVWFVVQMQCSGF